jgi:transcriptional regulator with XRE-family HTH domain
VEPHEQFARNLRKLRLERGLSQEGLGDLCALHRTEVSLLERAAREPRLSTMVKISRGLQVPLSELLHGIK